MATNGNVLAVEVFCARCDRPYHAKTFELAMEKVKKHVSLQHPGHDPYWYETHAKDHEGEE